MKTFIKIRHAKCGIKEETKFPRIGGIMYEKRSERSTIVLEVDTGSRE
jgi:hypothetical protein